MKRVNFFRVSVVLALAASLVVPAQAAPLPDEQWRAPLLQRNDLGSLPWKSFQIIDGVSAEETYSHLWATSFTGNTMNYRYVCSDTTDEKCSNPQFYEFLSVLPVCDQNTQADCVESLDYVKADGSTSKGKFNRYSLPNDPDFFTAKESLLIPKTSSASIWNLGDAPHNGGTEYAVLVTITGIRRPGQEIQDIKTQKFEAHLFPISSLKNAVWTGSNCPTKGISESTGKYALKKCHAMEFQYKENNSPKCVLLDGNSGDCFTQEAFPKDSNFSLKLRLTNNPNGWFHGRIDSPNIDLSSSNGITSLTVAAKPVRVPIFAQSGMWNDLSPAVKNFWLTEVTKCPNSQNCGKGIATNPVNPYVREGMETSMTAISQFPYGDFALTAVKLFASELKDIPNAAPSVWALRSLTNTWQTINSPENKCINQGAGLKGIVSTNSTAYAEGAPTFTDNTLNYKVASFHNLPDGSLFRGTYDLILRSDVARCLYAFSQAPISATIEILSENGQPQIATTTVNEKNGWLYLAAKNFTFSSPTVKVKLMQQEATKPAAGPSASPVPAKPALKKITCIKGKVKKIVKNANPKCPSGYKAA